jgi:hypothetical protein
LTGALNNIESRQMKLITQRKFNYKDNRTGTLYKGLDSILMDYKIKSGSDFNTIKEMVNYDIQNGFVVRIII